MTGKDLKDLRETAAAQFGQVGFQLAPSPLTVPLDFLKGSVCVLLLAAQELSLVQLRADGTLASPLKKLLSPATREELLQRTGASPGDLLLIAAGSLHAVVRD